MKRGTDPLRRQVLAATLGSGVAAFLAGLPGIAQAAEEPLATRPIPHSGEQLPIVGIGTAVIYDFANDSAKYNERRQVVQAFVAAGGKLIDTAHSYGLAEERVGDVVADLGVRDRLFLATKFSSSADRAAANASLQTSLRRLKTDRIDLMQAWNVSDPNYDFGLLREWKRQGLCRYIGMTTSFVRQYDAVSKVLVREKPDFVQLNYSLGDREAEAALLPAARDAGAAVLINLPFGRNSLFKKAAGRPLPDFAADLGATTWAQFFLKFILSHPAVTAVIPGTGSRDHMVDNLLAARGVLPDAAMRKRIIEYWDALA